ncbi:hypothetical protein DEO72_LG10g1302 [Vigna unguiculata]|uniref:Uncharacterized protein n=1 Tax=Vigna unguiculata TaxID=3917 RepID=A0A4D6N8I6_VIGUN|nr:hypothetical protein DEO72_LG10g1302 [Vigna unguiculata]
MLAQASSGSLKRESASLVGFPNDMCKSLEPLGETFRVALQWSEHNSMTPVSGCSWWCPICMVWYPPKVQASAESDQTICIRMSRVRDCGVLLFGVGVLKTSSFQATRPRLDETCRDKPRLALELSLKRRAFV